MIWQLWFCHLTSTTRISYFPHFTSFPSIIFKELIKSKTKIDMQHNWATFANCTSLIYLHTWQVLSLWCYHWRLLLLNFAHIFDIKIGRMNQTHSFHLNFTCPFTISRILTICIFTFSNVVLGRFIFLCQKLMVLIVMNVGNVTHLLLCIWMINMNVTVH